MLEPKQECMCQESPVGLCRVPQYTEARVSCLTEVVPLLDKLASEMIAIGYSNADRFSLCFAVREIISSALHRAQKRTVRVSFLVRSDYVLAEVIDGGIGSDAVSESAPVASDGRPRGQGRFTMRLLFSANPQVANFPAP